jgi:hypothetical protein
MGYRWWGCLFGLVAGWVTQPCLGWNDHERLTALSCGSLFSSKKEIAYIPLQTALSRGLTTIHARHRLEFVRQLKISKRYAFPLKLGEDPQRGITPLSVLTKYSDEPDWGMDQDLFSPNEYPELWNQDSPYVGGKTGKMSQGFRHVYFPGKIKWREPIGSLQIPMHPLGEAPERAAIFFDLAGDWLNRGEQYWGDRFLAIALHYVQDLFQPFHSRQSPTKRFWVFKWAGWRPSLDIEATADQIVYYHLSYEKWVQSQMQDPKSPLLKALAGTDVAATPHTSLREYLIDEVVDFSASYAHEVGRLSYRIFPRYKPEPGKKVEDFVGSKEWAAQIKPDEAFKLLVATEILFRRMGAVTRRLVVNLHPSGGPSGEHAHKY